ncbi:Rrt14p PWA37_002594 [Arxiozyma heterogenica]|uniref:Regulator of rDNA transcription 14 n=1 Tax=Arxiozyma heterogenica TaxID=278026 RepID=A0AAN8A922_9SACH|nr:hypothetical protein RI543_002193 [Kazachstania heterogenica]
MARLTATQLQANHAVNSLLAKILPGSPKVKVSRKSKKNNLKGSKAQLIDANLKQRVLLKQKDTLKIKKKQKQIAKAKVKDRRLALEQSERNAKLQILESHRQRDMLTTREKQYLDKLIKHNVTKVKSLDIDEEQKQELHELQEFILSNDNKKKLRSKKRRSKVKQFKEEIKPSSKKAVVDHRYPGLTPGLAPVGLSDEEESSSEEDLEEDYNDYD